MPQNAADGVTDALAAPSASEAPPFPVDRRTLALRRADLTAADAPPTVTLRFFLENPESESDPGGAILHVRLSASAAPWLTVTPTEAALGPGERQPVLVQVDSAAAGAELKSGGRPTVPVQLAYQRLRPAGADAAVPPPPVGVGAVYLRLPHATCPACGRPLAEDEETGHGPDVCPYCFERLRPCPVCGAPNSWLARRCVLDEEHVIRSSPDWPMLGGEPGHAGVLAEVTGALALSRRWSYPNVPPTRREQALAWSAPAAAYGLVAAAAATPEGEAHVFAFDALTGAPLWDPYPLAAPVYPDRGGVAIGAGGRLFAADIHGAVVAMDVLRGTRVWETRLDDAARVYGAATPAGEGLVLIAAAATDGAGCLFALEAETGKVRFRTPLPGPSDTAPAFAGGRVFAHTDDGVLVAIDAATGAALWSARCAAAPDDSAAAPGTGFDAAPVVREGHVFSAASSGTVWCHDVESGAEVWRLAVTNAPLAGTPAHDGTLLCLPADDGLHLVGAQAGRAVRRYPTRLPVRSAPVVLGNRLLFGATDGAVYGALPGRLLERLYETGPTGSQIVAAPAFADGALFVAATNGVLYALTVG